MCVCVLCLNESESANERREIAAHISYRTLMLSEFEIFTRGKLKEEYVNAIVRRHSLPFNTL